MKNLINKETAAAMNYTEQNTDDASRIETYHKSCIEEGNRFITALLDHMAECPEDYVPAVVSDSIDFTFRYAEEHPLYFLSPAHYRPLFTKKDSLWSDHPSYIKVKDSFQVYAEETGRDVIELLSYLNAITIMSLNSLSLERTKEETQDEIDMIKCIAMELFCILDNE